MRIRPQRRGGGKDFGSAAARKKKIKIFMKNLKNEKIAKIDKKHRLKTSILEELGINGRHHQILREKLPI